MNEELRIIISAETARATQNIQGVNSELTKLNKGSGSASKGFSSSMATVGMAAAAAAVAAVAAFTAITAALNNLSKSTAEYRKSMSQLTSAFQANGSNAEQAKQTYADLFRFMGETDTAVEAANLLSKLTTEEKELAEWTTLLQGIYATFPDSLPIEGLVEASNETAKVGKVTGSLADALNWAGVSEDAFNAQLAATNSEAEREALIRSTLAGLYGDAAQLYEKNASEILAQNEAQHRLNETMAQLGRVTAPLTTALTNLSSAFLEALTPAIEAITPILTTFINAIAKALGWVSAFFGALSGKEDTADTFEQVAQGIDKATNGAGSLSSGLGAAVTQAEKLKRATMGFDELNVISSQTSSSGSDGGGSTGSATGAKIPTGSIIDTTGFEDNLNKGSESAERFAERLKTAFGDIKREITEWVALFEPAFDSWDTAFDGIDWESIKTNFSNGIGSLKDSFLELSEYVLEDFIPNMANSFSTNLAPVIGDIFGFYLEEAGKNFEFLGGRVENVVDTMILPRLENLETVASDVFEIIGDAWDEHGGELLDNLGAFFDTFRERWETFEEEVINPIAEKADEVYDDVWTNGLKPLVDEVVDALMVIGNEWLILYNGIIAPVTDWILEKIYPIIVKVAEGAMEHVGKVMKNIAGFIQGLVKTLKGIAQFISGVFTGDWKKAWTGVKNIFSGIWESLVTIVKTPINKIIDGLNALLSGLTTAVNAVIKVLNKLSFDIPDWVPKYGGETFGFDLKEVSTPKIPRLATGGIVISETLARIGEGGKKEAVLPLEQNTGWMDMLAERIAARNSSPSKIVLMLDGKELGYASINSINQVTKQTGKLQLVLA